MRDVKIKKRIDNISIISDLEKYEEVNSQELDVIRKGRIPGLIAPDVTTGFTNKKSLSFDIYNCTPLDELISGNFTFYQFVQILQDAVNIMAKCHDEGIRASNIEKDKSLMFYDISGKRLTLLFWPLIDNMKADHDSDEKALLLAMTALFDTQDADSRFKVYFEDYLKKKDTIDLAECANTLSALKKRWLEQAELPPSEEETEEFSMIPVDIFAGTEILMSSASWYMRSGQSKKKTENDYYKAGASVVIPAISSEKETDEEEEVEEAWFYDEEEEKRSKRRMFLLILFMSLLSIVAGITVAKILAHRNHNSVPVTPVVKVEETESESESQTEETEVETTEREGFQIEVYIGKKFSEISAALEEAGIKIISSMVFSDREEEDVIIKQSVKPGSILYAGDEISFVISQGKELSDVETVTVPNLVGMSKDEAVSLLRSLNLNPVVREDYHDSVREGIVFEQWVDKGTELEEGESVSFVVSLGQNHSQGDEDNEKEPENKPEESQKPSETVKPTKPADQDEDHDEYYNGDEIPEIEYDDGENRGDENTDEDEPDDGGDNSDSNEDVVNSVEDDNPDAEGDDGSGYDEEDGD